MCTLQDTSQRIFFEFWPNGISPITKVKRSWDQIPDSRILFPGNWWRIQSSWKIPTLIRFANLCFLQKKEAGVRSCAFPVQWWHVWCPNNVQPKNHSIITQQHKNWVSPWRLKLELAYKIQAKCPERELIWFPRLGDETENKTKCWKWLWFVEIDGVRNDTYGSSVSASSQDVWWVIYVISGTSAAEFNWYWEMNRETLENVHD